MVHTGINNDDDINNNNNNTNSNYKSLKNYHYMQIPLVIFLLG